MTLVACPECRERISDQAFASCSLIDELTQKMGTLLGQDLREGASRLFGHDIVL